MVELDEGFQRSVEKHKAPVTRFLADLVERPSLSRDENAVAERIGDDMWAWVRRGARRAPAVDEFLVSARRD